VIKQLVLFIGLTAPALLAAQRAPLTLKLYTHTSIFESAFHPDLDRSKSAFATFGGFSLGVDFGKNIDRNLSHEIELFFHAVSETTTIDKTKEWRVHLRYEFKKYLFGSMQKRLKWAVGGTARLYSGEQKITPFTSASFPTTTRIVGQEIAGVIRSAFEITPQFLVDLNISFFNINMEFDRFEIENPVLNPNQQTSSSIDMNAFDQVVVRLGLGYTF
jgi:hypothetical protein